MIRIGEDSTGDPRDVEAIVRILQHAGRALERRDAAGVVAMFDPDDTTALFDFLAPGVTIVGDIRRNSGTIAETAVGEIVCRYPRVTVRVLSPDVAFSMAYSHVEVTTEGGARMEVHTRVTNHLVPRG